MTGAEWAAIASILGPTLSGLFGSDPQERKSFDGTNVSPLRMMNQANDFTNNFGRALAGRVSQGINLPSAVAQTPGAYTGGGLPMPIGVTAQDPALANPSLLGLQGLGAFQNLFSGSTGQSWYDDPNLTPGQPNVNTNPLAPEEGFDDFYQPDFTQQTPENRQGTTDGMEPRQGNWAEAKGTRRRSAENDGEYGELVRAADLDTGGGDDLNQALGSVQLLLEAFGGGRGATA